MGFRVIDVPRVVYRLLRPNYALRRDVVNGRQVLGLSRLYRFIVCCLYDVGTYFAGYDGERRRMFMIAACTGSQGQIIAILNGLYGEYGDIYLGGGQNFQSIYFYDSGSTTAENRRYLYGVESGNALYLGYEGASANMVTIFIPRRLQENGGMYSDFIADLNAMMVYSLDYVVLTYG